MSQVKSNGNRSTELKILALFKGNRITGWRRKYTLFGKPDFVFPKQRVAMFVDGCFWHGHPTKCRMPATNTEYWERKISRNQARDREVNQTLKKKGWKIVRVWEDCINKPSTLFKIRKALQ